MEVIIGPMEQKYLYIVNHYVPFPQSEYGGIWNVIAENETECFDLITAQDDGEFNRQYYTNLRENILNAHKFPIDSEHESRIVEEFTT